MLAFVKVWKYVLRPLGQQCHNNLLVLHFSELCDHLEPATTPPIASTLRERPIKAETSNRYAFVVIRPFNSSALLLKCFLVEVVSLIFPTERICIIRKLRRFKGDINSFHFKFDHLVRKP